MFVLKTLIFSAAWLTCLSQSYNNGPTTTPVPILKQINRQNDDGSYSFGYEAADGSFKIETKYPNGDVAGKYGYVDVDGKQREVSYGASSQRGFEPEGTGIMVPPPTLNDHPTNALTDGQEDDGQYREDPRIYEDPKYNGRTQGARPSSSFSFKQTSPAAQPQYQQQYQQPAYQPASTFKSSPLFTQASSFSQPQQQTYNQAPQTFPQDRQNQVYHQQPQFSFQSSFTPQYQNYQPQTYQPQTYQPQTYQAQNYQAQNYQAQNYNPFLGHPATNIDPSTGSYSINFTGKK